MGLGLLLAMAAAAASPESTWSGGPPFPAAPSGERTERAGFVGAEIADAMARHRADPGQLHQPDQGRGHSHGQHQDTNKNKAGNWVAHNE